MFFIVLNASAQTKFTAKSGKNTIALNENVKIHFEFNDTKFKNFKPPKFNGFKIVNGPKMSVSSSLVNGKRIYRISYTYTLQPKKSGKLTISFATINGKGKLYKTNPLKINVLNSIPKINKPIQKEKLDNESINTSIEKIGIKLFLDQAIPQKKYTIDFLEKSISGNNYYHSLLLNRAVRFKVFMDMQEYLTKLYSYNCKNYSYEIKLNNLGLKNKFEQGFKNSIYLLEIAKKKEPNFDEKVTRKFNTQKEEIGSFLNFSDPYCNAFLKEIEMRSKGIFNGNNLKENVLSFNYLLDPVKEITNGHVQKFSSIDNASNEGFFFTIDLPISWSIKAQKDFSNPTTVGFFEAYQRFYNASVSISILPEQFVSKEEMKSQNISDSDLIEFIYEDEGVLLDIIRIFNSKMSNNKIKYFLCNTGTKRMILYTSFADMGEVSGNEILSGKIIEYMGSINVKNGKVINVFCSSLKTDEFNSYAYYSKLFFKVITSIKFKNLKKNTIYLTEEQNMKFLELNFNGLTYKFMLDTGASNVIINKSILSDLLSNDIISKENYVGDSYAKIADGSIIACQNWLVPKLNIGNQTIKNLIVSVIDSENSMLLFGMGGLKKLKVQELNLNENEIILNRE